MAEFNFPRHFSKVASAPAHRWEELREPDGSSVFELGAVEEDGGSADASAGVLDLDASRQSTSDGSGSSVGGSGSISAARLHDRHDNRRPGVAAVAQAARLRRVVSEASQGASSGEGEPTSDAALLPRRRGALEVEKADTHGGLDDGGAGRPTLERRSSWFQVAFLIIADIVGIGVLELAGNMRKLGWLPGILVIVCTFFPSLYTGFVLSRLERTYPNSLSYGELGRSAISPLWKVIVDAMFAIYLFLNLGSLILVLAESWQGILYDTRLCLLPASLIGAATVLPFAQIRALHNVSGLALLSTACIVAAVLIVIVELVLGNGLAEPNSQYPPGTQLVADTDFLTAMTAVAGVLFAYGGQTIYMELIAEMIRPEDFPKALLLSGPVLVCIYVIAASFGYAYLGGDVPANMLEAIPEGATKRVANVLMLVRTGDALRRATPRRVSGAAHALTPCTLTRARAHARARTHTRTQVHILVSYVLNNQILTRFIHVRISPRTANVKPGPRGWVRSESMLSTCAISRLDAVLSSVAEQYCTVCVHTWDPCYVTADPLVMSRRCGLLFGGSASHWS